MIVGAQTLVAELCNLFDRAIKSPSDRWRRPPQLRGRKSRVIKTLTVYACELFSGSRSLFNRFEHQFVVMGTKDGKFLLTQIQYGGTELTEEVSLQDCLAKGVKRGKVNSLKHWIVHHYVLSPLDHRRTVGDVVKFYYTRRPHYELTSRNCQHYAQEWYDWV